MGVAGLENDDAQDLIADFEDEGWAAITGAIGAVGQSRYVEAPLAARVIAAAEIIAAGLGHGDSQLPKIEFPRRSPEPSQLVPLRDSALSALSRIRGDSELHDLWDEAGQLAEWKRTLDGLALRLQIPPRRAPVAPRPRLARLIEGSCYAIPLPSGGYALGVLTQMLGGKLPFGYFFGPRSDEPPGQVALAKLRPEATFSSEVRADRDRQRPMALGGRDPFMESGRMADTTRNQWTGGRRNGMARRVPAKRA